MLEVDRKVQASVLLGSYQGKASKLKAVGDRMAETWVANQAKFFADVCAELEEIIATGDLPEAI